MDKDMCPSCGKKAATEPHECPFKAELHDDVSTCTCCDDCQEECYMEV